jgi:phosphate transport system substrate-binding protein
MGRIEATEEVPDMISSTAPVLALILGMLAGSAAAQITYVGSSTIGETIMPEAARAFTAKTGISFGSIEIQGSGKGLEMVLRGEAQLAGVSRSLSSQEKQQRFYYRIIGYDAVGIFVHPTNPLTTLTREQLKAVYTGRITNWKELGGVDAPIGLITVNLGSGRGLVSELQDSIMDGAPYREDRIAVELQREAVAALVAQSDGITAASPAFALAGIKALTIDGFAPEPQHVQSGAYLLSRPLLLVSQAHPPGQIKQFIDFMLSPEGQEIVARIFVPVR